jgi:hypothetical protein
VPDRAPRAGRGRGTGADPGSRIGAVGRRDCVGRPRADRARAGAPREATSPPYLFMDRFVRSTFVPDGASPTSAGRSPLSPLQRQTSKPSSA